MGGYSRGFNAEHEMKAMRREMQNMRAPATLMALNSEQIRELSERLESARALSVRLRKTMESQDRVIETQQKQITQLQDMVVQLIERGRIPCQDPSHSSSSESHSQ